MRLLLPLLLLSACCLAQQRPNILYIMSDDHDARAISAYDTTLIRTPHIDRLAKEGMLFRRCFVGNSICAPSRATLLTGQHSHKNGVKNNSTRFDSSRVTLPALLRDAGYQTAIVGKWHLHSYPTGFDYWRILPGMGQYYNTRMITMQGDTITENGYATDVITNDAIHWLDKRDTSKPFAFLLHQKAPHRYFFPALKYLELYHTKTFPEPATLYVDTTGRGTAWRTQTMSILHDMLLCSDLKVDPQYLADMPALKPDSAEVAYYNAIMRRVPEPERSRFKAIYAERGQLLQRLRPTGDTLLKYKYQWYMQDYLACVASVDESVGRVLQYLDDNGLTKNTLVVYTSDQGFYLGENDLFDKRFMYDKSMRTPLLMRWPGHIRAGSVSNVMAQNIDFAPTLLGAAGVQVPSSMQGISLLPVLTGRSTTLNRPYLYYHYYEFVKDHTVLPHLGIRGDRYKLIYFYTANEWELYDEQTDPQEQKNLVRLPQYQQLVKELKKELLNLRNKYDDHEPAGELH